MKHTTTKKALLASVLSVIVCFSMLIGSTFAWFTDTASTGVNTIQSGKLDVALEMLVDGKWVDAEGKTLGFVDETGKVLTDILWEPGCSYLLQPFRIVNNGNLALKFDVIVSGISGDLKLAEVIEYGMPLGDASDPQFYAMGNLLDFNDIFNSVEQANLTVLQPKKSFDTESDKITFHMKESAGNEYQGLTLSGMSITVVATQLNSENDSFGPDYDIGAEWPLVMTDDAATLVKTLSQNQDAKIILDGDVILDDVTDIDGDKVIDLNGYTLTIIEQKGITVSGNTTFTVQNGTVKYTGSDFAPIYVSDNSIVNIEDGTVFDITSSAEAGKWSMAAAVYVNQGSNSTVNINGGVINVTGDNAIGVYANYAGGGNHTINLNGGVINVNGKNAIGMEVVSKNTINLNGGIMNINGTDALAFNVGQSQGQPTVVAGNGKTVVNLYEGTSLCDDEDAAQFEGVAFTVNQAKVLSGTTEEVNTELKEIINKSNEPTLVELPKGEYTLPALTNKEVTIVGDKDTVIDAKNLQNTNGTDITFDGVTVEFANVNYKGFQHSDKVVYKNAHIVGKQFLYSDTEFINCTFENKDDYCIWTYGAENVTFTDCTFNTGGKAILVYNEMKNYTGNITIKNCTFNDDNTLNTVKAAVETGIVKDSQNVYNITFEGCTVNGFALNDEGINTGTTLYGNKNSMDAEHLKVVIK